MPNDEIVKAAERLAIKMDFDGVEFVKEDQGTFVFEAFCKTPLNVGLPPYILVKNGEASFYSGFKYLD